MGQRPTDLATGLLSPVRLASLTVSSRTLVRRASAGTIMPRCRQQEVTWHDHLGGISFGSPPRTTRAVFWPGAARLWITRSARSSVL
jgi:hypothetical protein